MGAKASRSVNGTQPRGKRLVVISAEAEGARATGPPVRIVGSEPRMRGSFRLTDR